MMIGDDNDEDDNDDDENEDEDDDDDEAGDADNEDDDDDDTKNDADNADAVCDDIGMAMLIILLMVMMLNTTMMMRTATATTHVVPDPSGRNLVWSSLSPIGLMQPMGRWNGLSKTRTFAAMASTPHIRSVQHGPRPRVSALHPRNRTSTPS